MPAEVTHPKLRQWHQAPPDALADPPADNDGRGDEPSSLAVPSRSNSSSQTARSLKKPGDFARMCG